MTTTEKMQQLLREVHTALALANESGSEYGPTAELEIRALRGEATHLASGLLGLTMVVEMLLEERQARPLKHLRFTMGGEELRTVLRSDGALGLEVVLELIGGGTAEALIIVSERED